MPETIDLGALTASQGFKIQGEAAGDNAGYSVSSAGDVNGDGIDDLIVGAPYNSEDGTYTGAAYVIYGTDGNRTGILELDSLTDSYGFKILGEAADGEAGISVSSAGDVNGDGIDDLIVGVPDNTYTGAAYVIYGTDGNRTGTLELDSLTVTDGFKILGEAIDGDAGFSVSSAGDVNGDDIDDLIVGAPDDSEGGYYAGAAYVIYGTNGNRTGTLELDSLTDSDGFKIVGITATYEYNEYTYYDGDDAGSSVSSAGDVNGDGIDDLIVGAPNNDEGGTDAGAAYVIYGTDGNRTGTLELDSLTVTDGFKIVGEGYAGACVSSAGDVNGDGIDDLIVGANYNDEYINYVPAAYVIYGTSETRGTLNLSNLTGDDGFKIVSSEYDGYDIDQVSVSSAGDVNGDGIDDLIVGVTWHAPGDTYNLYPGAAYVIYGTSAVRSTLDLASLTNSDGFKILGENAEDGVGCSVSSAGDVNGDDIDDLIVGADANDDGGNNAGAAYVIYGTNGSTENHAPVFTSSSYFFEIFESNLDYAYVGPVAATDADGDDLTYSILGDHDVDGDGNQPFEIGSGYLIIADMGDIDYSVQNVFNLTISATDGLLEATTAVEIRVTNERRTYLSHLTEADGFKIVGAKASNHAGWCVSSAGDVNGDGFDDLISSGTYVIYGTREARTSLDLSSLTEADGFKIDGETFGPSRGKSVSSAGDVNGDGLDDLILGANIREYFSYEAVVSAYVIYGTREARTSLDLSSLTEADGFKIHVDIESIGYGYNVSSAGDVNGDGFDDVIVGSYSTVYVIYGSDSDRGTLDLSSLTPAVGFKIVGTPWVNTGTRVSDAGDVNGDGINDLIVGGASVAYVIYGINGNRTSTLDLDSLTNSDGFKIVNAGVSISSAGDVNGDGIDDLILGASENDEGGYGADAAYVIYGINGHRTGTLDLASLAASDGFKIVSESGSELSVSSAGDVNGDGIDDLILGAKYLSAGRAYVIFGTSDARTTLYLDNLTYSDGVKIHGERNFDQAGSSVSDAGDVNGDGIDDLIVGAHKNDEGGKNAGAAYVIYGALPDQAVTRTGTDIGQTIFGGAYDDTLNGLGGGDTLIGGFGNDQLDGGDGFDTASYFSSILGLTVSLALTPSQNTIGAGWDVLSNIENLTGGSGNDKLTGNISDNVLDGGLGLDRLVGGAGNDTYIVDLIEATGKVKVILQDTIVETSTGGTLDTVQLRGSSTNAVAVTLTAGTGIEAINASATGSSKLNLTGNASRNILTGNDADNILNGGTGIDTLSGGAGNDTYIVDTLTDTITEATNGGTDAVKSSVTFSLASLAEIENLTLTGTSAINGTGNTADNILTGNSAANTLNGVDGSDTLIGGLGNDSLTGGNGADHFVFNTPNAKNNKDTITDFIHGTDVIDLSKAIFKGLGSTIGSLSSDAFYSGAGVIKSHDLDDRIIYNTTNGFLYYDADGTGKAAAIQIAILSNEPSDLSYSDFAIIG